MEIWLAVFGLVAAVLMIWMARGRHRGGPSGSSNTAAHRGTGKGAGNGGGNGNSSDGDGGGGD
jgi:hypothetical protein